MANSQSESGIDPAALGIKVVASKSCPSLSGKCTITYKLGRDAENTLHIRLHGNTGGGFFNNEWYPAQTIVEALQEAGNAEPVTSRVLAPLFRGRSANTPAFFTAALRNEGVLQQYKRTERRHLVGDLDAFLNQTPSKPVQSKKSPRKKSPPKKKAPSRAKSKASPAE